MGLFKPVPISLPGVPSHSPLRGLYEAEGEGSRGMKIFASVEGLGEGG